MKLVANSVDIIGHLKYEEEKKAVEEFKGNQYTKEESAARHNVAQQRTSEKIAKDNKGMI